MTPACRMSSSSSATADGHAAASDTVATITVRNRCRNMMSPPSSRFGADQDRPEVVDVGPRRTRDDGIAERLEESVPVVVGQAVTRLDATGPRAPERVGRDHGAGDLLLAVDAVGIAGDRVDARSAVEGDGERQEELDVAAAAPLAAHG